MLGDKYKPAKTKEEDDKIVLSDDAYAISEMIELLINKLEQARRTFIK
jgi:hypothetical protein